GSAQHYTPPSTSKKTRSSTYCPRIYRNRSGARHEHPLQAREDRVRRTGRSTARRGDHVSASRAVRLDRTRTRRRVPRSEEHTSELQSRFDLVCRLLLE